MTLCSCAQMSIDEVNQKLSQQLPIYDQLISIVHNSGFCLDLSVYWPTLLVESNGQGWVRMLVRLLIFYIIHVYKAIR